MGLVSIGEFSRLSRLSPKALCLYDELGLLVPDHVEVSGDSDGPVEFCWPVPSDQAAEIAARFPDLTLRAEPGHQEAFVGQGRPGIWGNEAEAEVAIESLIAWASEQQRQPSGGVRMLLVFNPANQEAGPDTEFAVALR